MMYPEEVWYNIKHYDMPLESFQQFLLDYEIQLKEKWNVTDNIEQEEKSAKLV